MMYSYIIIPRAEAGSRVTCIYLSIYLSIYEPNSIKPRLLFLNSNVPLTSTLGYLRHFHTFIQERELSEINYLEIKHKLLSLSA